MKLFFFVFMACSAYLATAVIVSQTVTPTLSRPVRELSKSSLQTTNGEIRILPRKVPKSKVPLSDIHIKKTKDTALQGSSSENCNISSTLNFDGIGFTAGNPPDTVGDVGPSNYVQMVNSAGGAQFAIYNKTGTLVSGPTELSSLWPAADPAATGGYGDPIVMYDHIADRWFLSQLALPDGPYNPPFYLGIAISKTSDPAGQYYVYTFNVGNSLPDYPKYAVWPDGYYMASNESDVGIWAFDRAKMLVGQAATYQKKMISTRNFMLPCDLDGATLPPTGSPNYFYTMMDDTYWPAQGVPGVDRLEIWEFHVDWTTPANSTFIHTQNITNAPFNYDVGDNPSDWEVIPQPDTSKKLDAIGEWPMWRLQYRNFGSYATLVGNFTVDVTGNKLAGIRWFELRKPGTDIWNLHQEGTYSPDSNQRWMGSAAMNGNGDIALGYSVSSSTVYPSLRIAARLSGATPGTIGPETNFITSTASQTGSERWGDYSAMTVDPVDESFWYTHEYVGADNNWRTRIIKFAIVPEPCLFIIYYLSFIIYYRSKFNF